MGYDTLTPKDIRLSNIQQTNNPSFDCTTFVLEVLTVHEDPSTPSYTLF